MAQTKGRVHPPRIQKSGGFQTSQFWAEINSYDRQAHSSNKTSSGGCASCARFITFEARCVRHWRLERAYPLGGSAKQHTPDGRNLDTRAAHQLEAEVLARCELLRSKLFSTKTTQPDCKRLITRYNQLCISFVDPELAIPPRLHRAGGRQKFWDTTEPIPRTAPNVTGRAFCELVLNHEKRDDL